MIAVGVLISDTPDLTQLHMRVASAIRVFLVRWGIRIVSRLTWHRRVGLSEILTRQQQHLFVESADNRDLRLLLLSWLL